MMRIPSSMRSARSWMGIPTTSCSSTYIWLSPRPAPAPRMVRPLETLSMVARAWARCTGWRRAESITAVPMRTRWVRAARADIMVRGSRRGLDVTLSPTHTES